MHQYKLFNRVHIYDYAMNYQIKRKVFDEILSTIYRSFGHFSGLDDWDFIGLNDFNANIRWFNVDSRSIIATVNQTAGKAASALNKAISMNRMLV